MEEAMQHDQSGSGPQEGGGASAAAALAAPLSRGQIESSLASSSPQSVADPQIHAAVQHNAELAQQPNVTLPGFAILSGSDCPNNALVLQAFEQEAQRYEFLDVRSARRIVRNDGTFYGALKRFRLYNRSDRERQDFPLHQYYLDPDADVYLEEIKQLVFRADPKHPTLHKITAYLASCDKTTEDLPKVKDYAYAIILLVERLAIAALSSNSPRAHKKLLEAFLNNKTIQRLCTMNNAKGDKAKNKDLSLFYTSICAWVNHDLALYLDNAADLESHTDATKAWLNYTKEQIDCFKELVIVTLYTYGFGERGQLEAIVKSNRSGSTYSEWIDCLMPERASVTSKESDDPKDRKDIKDTEALKAYCEKDHTKSSKLSPDQAKALLELVSNLNPLFEIRANLTSLYDVFSLMGWSLTILGAIDVRAYSGYLQETLSRIKTNYMAKKRLLDLAIINKLPKEFPEVPSPLGTFQNYQSAEAVAKRLSTATVDLLASLAGSSLITDHGKKMILQSNPSQNISKLLQGMAERGKKSLMLSGEDGIQSEEGESKTRRMYSKPKDAQDMDEMPYESVIYLPAMRLFSALIPVLSDSEIAEEPSMTFLANLLGHETMAAYAGSIDQHFQDEEAYLQYCVRKMFWIDTFEAYLTLFNDQSDAQDHDSGDELKDRLKDANTFSSVGFTNYKMPISAFFLSLSEGSEDIVLDQVWFRRSLGALSAMPEQVDTLKKAKRFLEQEFDKNIEKIRTKFEYSGKNDSLASRDDPWAVMMKCKLAKEKGQETSFLKTFEQALRSVKKEFIVIWLAQKDIKKPIDLFDHIHFLNFRLTVGFIERLPCRAHHVFLDKPKLNRLIQSMFSIPDAALSATTECLSRSELVSSEIELASVIAFMLENREIFKDTKSTLKLSLDHYAPIQREGSDKAVVSKSPHALFDNMYNAYYLSDKESKQYGALYGQVMAQYIQIRWDVFHGDDATKAWLLQHTCQQKNKSAFDFDIPSLRRQYQKDVLKSWCERAKLLSAVGDNLSKITTFITAIKAKAEGPLGERFEVLLRALASDVDRVSEASDGLDRTDQELWHQFGMLSLDLLVSFFEKDQIQTQFDTFYWALDARPDWIKPYYREWYNDRSYLSAFTQVGLSRFQVRPKDALGRCEQHFGTIEDKADGNCLFHAFSFKLRDIERKHEGVPYTHETLRARAVAELEAHPDDYASFVAGGWDQYIENMKKDSVWADHLEIRVLATYLKLNVVIIDLEGRSDHHKCFPEEKYEGEPTLALLYSGTHYYYIQHDQHEAIVALQNGDAALIDAILAKPSAESAASSGHMYADGLIPWAHGLLSKISKEPFPSIDRWQFFPMGASQSLKEGLFVDFFELCINSGRYDWIEAMTKPVCFARHRPDLLLWNDFLTKSCNERAVTLVSDGICEVSGDASFHKERADYANGIRLAKGWFTAMKDLLAKLKAFDQQGGKNYQDYQTVHGAKCAAQMMLAKRSLSQQQFPTSIADIKFSLKSTSTIAKHVRDRLGRWGGTYRDCFAKAEILRFETAARGMMALTLWSSEPGISLEEAVSAKPISSSQLATKGVVDTQNEVVKAAQEARAVTSKFKAKEQENTLLKEKMAQLQKENNDLKRQQQNPPVQAQAQPVQAPRNAQAQPTARSSWCIIS
jgi:hypothetical protein